MFNCRKKLITTMLIGLSLATMARIPGRGGTTISGPSSGGSVDSPDVGVPGTTVASGNGESCDPTTGDGYVAQNFLRNIVDPSVSSPNELKLVNLGNGQYKVEMAKHVKACTKLDFDVVEANNNYFVRVKNNFDFNESNVPLNEGEDLANLSSDEKYYRCIEAKGLLTNGSFDRVKAESTGEISYGISSRPFTVDIGSGEDSVNVFFASEKATSYSHPYDAGVVSPHPSGWSCVVYENFNNNEPTRLYTSEKDRVYDRAIKVCETESAEEILAELAKLKESDAGNFRALEKILEQAFEQAQEKRVEEIYSRMEDIEKAMKQPKDGEFIGEERAGELAEEYSDLAEEINNILIQPSVAKIEELEQIRDGDNSDEIDDRIEELREKIGSFRDEHEKGLNNWVYPTLEEYALVDEARNIRGLWLASKHYGEEGKDLSVSDAGARITNGLRHFEENYLNHWEAEYALSNGSRAPLDAQAREVRRQKEQLDRHAQRFQEQRQLCARQCSNNYLDPKRNPARCRVCQRSMSSDQQRFMQQRTHMLNNMRTSANRYTQYQSTFDDYLASRVDDYSNDPYGSSYDAYDPYSPQNYSMDSSYGGTDNSWMYNLGVQQNMGGMPNGMMMNNSMNGAQIRAPGATGPYMTPMMR